MKKFFRKIAVFFVTAYARRIYSNAVKTADARHKKEGVMIYVASETFRPDHLTTYDRWQFKNEKRAFGYLARIMTLQTLKNGCWYHTPDTAGNQEMSISEMERRRRAFIRERLAKAGLLEERVRRRA